MGRRGAVEGDEVELGGEPEAPVGPRERGDEPERRRLLGAARVDRVVELLLRAVGLGQVAPRREEGRDRVERRRRELRRPHEAMCSASVGPSTRSWSLRVGQAEVEVRRRRPGGHVLIRKGLVPQRATEGGLDDLVIERQRRPLADADVPARLDPVPAAGAALGAGGLLGSVDHGAGAEIAELGSIGRSARRRSRCAWRCWRPWRRGRARAPPCLLRHDQGRAWRRTPGRGHRRPRVSPARRLPALRRRRGRADPAPASTRGGPAPRGRARRDPRSTPVVKSSRACQRKRALRAKRNPWQSIALSSTTSARPD